MKPRRFSRDLQLRYLFGGDENISLSINEMLFDPYESIQPNPPGESDGWSVRSTDFLISQSGRPLLHLGNALIGRHRKHAEIPKHQTLAVGRQFRIPARSCKTIAQPFQETVFDPAAGDVRQCRSAW